VQQQQKTDSKDNKKLTLGVPNITDSFFGQRKKGTLQQNNKKQNKNLNGIS
jgi:hypothetical protein